MKTIIASAAMLALLAYGAVAQSRDVEPRIPVPAPGDPAPALGWGRVTDPPPRPHSLSPAPVEAPAPLPASLVAASDPARVAADIDVVDAHWMALTMWGEARREGEIGMRAVGHVIDNRRRSGRHGGYATDTVSEAYQFSCWNPRDPNRTAMENVDRADPNGADGRAWAAAKAIAAEILAGRSQDPTGGALFYHTDAVAPAWSRGVPPVTRIGSHLFFLTAR